MYFELISAARKNRRAAAGAEMPSVVCMCLAFDLNRIRGKDRGGIEYRAVMFSAVKTMTETNAMRASGCDKPNFSAETAAGCLVHDVLSIVGSEA